MIKKTNFENILEVIIESLGGLGDGIGTYADKPVFVPKAVVGDFLRVRVVNKTSEITRAEIVEIIKPSKDRRDAPCPHFSACGGCSMQQLPEVQYKEFKQKIVNNALRQAGFALHSDDESALTLTLSQGERGLVEFLPAASRRRAEFKMLKENGKWCLAYMGNRSHNKVAISTCLILEPALQKLLPLLAELVGATSFAKDIDAVSLTAADSGIEVILALSQHAKLPTPTNAYDGELRDISNILKLTRLSIADGKAVPISTIEHGNLTMRLGNVDMNLPHDAFLQATSEGQKLLTEFTISGMAGKKQIADLFCGIGTYSIALAENAAVHAVDDHFIMVENLRHAAKKNNMRLTTEKRNLFVKPLTSSELKGYDGVVINPPRAGAKAQCEQIGYSAVKNVVMISCNPASFARDAKILANAGFKLDSAKAIDQFVWSPHLEIAASFSR